jgi:hypothetical protein
MSAHSSQQIQMLAVTKLVAASAAALTITAT